jgi:hypothetical protein
VTRNTRAMVNSALADADIGAAQVPTGAAVQALVNAYSAILALADGVDNNHANDPAAEVYSAIGVNGVSSVAQAIMLGDVIDGKTSADINTVDKIQALANAVQAVLGYDDPVADAANAPTAAQINTLIAGQTVGGSTLGTNTVSADALAAVRAAIDAANSDGTPIASQQELANLVKAAVDGYNINNAELGNLVDAANDAGTAGYSVATSPSVSLSGPSQPA